MPEVYTASEVTAELLDPITGEVITTVSIPYRRDLTISERPVYAQRGYHRSNTLSAAHLRSMGSVSLRKDAESLALAAEIKRWQKGVVFYALSSDLKGKRYRHPHLRVTFTNADGSTDVVTAYNVKLSDRSLSAPDGGIVGDSISLDVLGGFEPKDGGYEPVRALDFHRTGSKTYVGADGTIKTAGDGVAAFGLPWVVRRNLLNNSSLLEPVGGAAANWSYGSVTALSCNNGEQTFTAEAQFNGFAQGRAIYPSVSQLTIRVKIKGTGATFDSYFYDSVGAYLGGGSLQPLGTPDADGFVEFVIIASYPEISSVNFRVSDGRPGGWTPITFKEPHIEIGSHTVIDYQPTGLNGVDYTSPIIRANMGLVLEGGGKNWVTNPTLSNPVGGLASAWFAGSAGTLICTNGEQTFTVGSQYGAVSQSVDFGAATGPITLSAEIKADRAYLIAYLYDASDAYLDAIMSQTVTDSAGFTQVSATTHRTDVKRIEFRIEDNRVSGWTPITFRRPQAEIRAFATSFMDGERASDLCGIVHLQNELTHSRDLTQGAWSKTAGASVSKVGTSNTLTLVATSDAITQAVTPASVPGATRTAAAKLRLGTLSGSVRLRLLDQAGTQIASTTISTADLHATDARTFTVTGAAAADASGLQVQVIGSSGAGTVIVESLRLVRGHHPGIDVETFDTPIPAPVSPALDPAWSQNGRLKIRILPPPLFEGTNVNFVGYGNFGSTLALWRWAGWTTSQPVVSFERGHDKGRGALEPVVLFYDGSPHDVILEWTNEINEQTGAREMWQRIWVDYDGVDAAGNPIPKLVASQDVAALYGATAWADIDPSRLISDGNVFAVLSELVTEYPAPRAGYRPA